MPRHWVVEFDTCKAIYRKDLTLEKIGTLDLSLFIRSLATLAFNVN